MLARTTGDCKFLFPYFFFGIDIFIYFLFALVFELYNIEPLVTKICKNIYIKILINYLFI